MALARGKSSHIADINLSHIGEKPFPGAVTLPKSTSVTLANLAGTVTLPIAEKSAADVAKANHHTCHNSENFWHNTVAALRPFCYQEFVRERRKVLLEDYPWVLEATFRARFPIPSCPLGAKKIGTKKMFGSSFQWHEWISSMWLGWSRDGFESRLEPANPQARTLNCQLAKARSPHFSPWAWFRAWFTKK